MTSTSPVTFRLNKYLTSVSTHPLKVALCHLAIKLPPRVVITELQILLAVMEPSRLRMGLEILRFLLVLLAQNPPQRSHDHDVHNQIPQRKRVAQNVPRRRLGPVQLRSEDCSAVSDGDLHGVCGGALGLAGDVDCGPGEDERDRRVDADGGEEGADVRDARLLGRRLVG